MNDTGKESAAVKQAEEQSAKDIIDQIRRRKSASGAPEAPDGRFRKVQEENLVYPDNSDARPSSGEPGSDPFKINMSGDGLDDILSGLEKPRRLPIRRTAPKMLTPQEVMGGTKSSGMDQISFWADDAAATAEKPPMPEAPKVPAAPETSAEPAAETISESPPEVPAAPKTPPTPVRVQKTPAKPKPVQLSFDNPIEAPELMGRLRKLAGENSETSGKASNNTPVEHPEITDIFSTTEAADIVPETRDADVVEIDTAPAPEAEKNPDTAGPAPRPSGRELFDSLQKNIYRSSEQPAEVREIKTPEIPEDEAKISNIMISDGAAILKDAPGEIKMRPLEKRPVSNVQTSDPDLSPAATEPPAATETDSALPGHRRFKTPAGDEETLPEIVPSKAADSHAESLEQQPESIDFVLKMFDEEQPPEGYSKKMLFYDEDELSEQEAAEVEAELSEQETAPPPDNAPDPSGNIKLAALDDDSEMDKLTAAFESGKTKLALDIGGDGEVSSHSNSKDNSDWERECARGRRENARNFSLRGENEPDFEEETLPPDNFDENGDFYDEEYDDGYYEDNFDYTCIDDADAVRRSILKTQVSLRLRCAVTFVLMVFLSLPFTPVIGDMLPTASFAFTVISVLAVLLIAACNFNTVLNLFSFEDGIHSDAPVAALTLAGAVVAILSLGVPDLRTGMLYPVVAFSMLFNIIGKLSAVKRTVMNFSMIANKSPKKAVYLREEIDGEESGIDRISGGTKLPAALICLQRGTVNARNFLFYSFGGDPGKNINRLFVPISVLAAAVLAAVMFFSSGAAAAANTLIVLLAAAAPLSITLIPNSALKRTDQALKPRRAAIMGIGCAESFHEANVLAIDSADLFPAGTVRLTNFRSFDGLQIHLAIPFAAAMAVTMNSVLADMFFSVIEGKQELPKVEDAKYEEKMGLSAWVNGKNCLLGSRDLMIAHSIKVPDIEVDKKILRAGHFPVYFACDGELSTLFIAQYIAEDIIKDALQSIEQQGFTLMIKSVDPNVGADMISDYFDIDRGCVVMTNFAETTLYNEETADVMDADAPIVHSGNAESYLGAVSACCKLMSGVKSAIMLQTVLSVLGMAAFAVMAYKAPAMLSLPLVAGYMFAQLIISMIPTLKNTTD